MADTVVSQTRENLVDAEGTQVYRVISVVTDEGDLPHRYVFVTTIVNPEDPTADMFLRVATPYDLTNLQVDRDAAITLDATIFLSAYSHIDFSALEVAIQAAQEINGRINTLVISWKDYIDNFYTPTAETLTFPNADPGYVQELKDAYVVARDARIDAEEDLEEKSEDLVAAEAALSAATSTVSDYALLVASITDLVDPINGSWSILNTKLTAHKSADDTFFDAMKTAYGVWSTTAWSPTTPPNPLDDWADMYAAMLAWYNGELIPWGTVIEPKMTEVNDLTSFLNDDISTQYAVAVNNETNASTAVNEATTEKEKATAVLAAAQSVEDAALAAVLGVCSDFDPASV